MDIAFLSGMSMGQIKNVLEQYGINSPTSIIMKRLGIPHVAYTLLQEDAYPYSLCEDFITADTELISAWHIMQTKKKENHVSLYQHYLDCCNALGILDVKKSVEQMIILDYLILNEDRHLNNFGVIRNDVRVYWSGTDLR